MKQPTGLRRRWYLLTLIPLGIGAAIMVVSLRSMLESVERMPRVVVPGTGELALEARDYVAYAENESRFHGTVYMTASLELRCKLVASDGGAPVELATPSTETSYRLGGFAGHSMFKLTIPRAGSYQFTCEGQGGPMTVAFGAGLGIGIASVMVGPLVAALGTIFIVVWVRRRRRRSRAVRPGTAPPAAPA